MAENYPKWDQIEKRLRQFWADSYPREKIVEIKQTKKELESGTERVENSLVQYQHVYYYGDITVTKPDGGKYLYPMRVAYYQIPGQPQWNFHYASPGEYKILEKGTGEDPLKLTSEKAIDIVKKYVDIMIQKYFPPAKWKDYCTANSVEVKIAKVSFQAPPSELQWQFDDINNKIKMDTSESFRTGVAIDGEYKDKTGKFKFRLQNVFASFYLNAEGGFWSLAYNRKPVDQLTPNDFSDLKDKLLETAEEPRKVLEQYVPEASPRDKAIALMRDTDPNKKRDGIDAIKWIQGFADDEEIIDMLSNFLRDKDQSVVNYAKSMIENAANQTTKTSTKDKIKAALEARAKADVAAEGAAKAGVEAEKEAQYKKWVAELSDPSKASSALNFLRARWSQRILSDDEAMNGIISTWTNNKLTDARMYLDQVRAYDKDKISPEILAKINEVLGTVQTGPKDKASAPATSSAPAQQVDEYAQATADFKDPKKVRDALKKIKSKRDYSEKIVKDDAALESLVNVWLKKGEFDSSTRSDVRSFLDNTKSYSKDKLNPETLKKIEDAFKTVRS